VNITDLKREINLNDLSQEMYQFIAELYPICRSITGNGFRETMHLIENNIP
jgi:aminopeptidase-like protein